MRIHTSDFKNEIGRYGRQIDGRIYYYSNYNLTTEDNTLLLTESNLELITEQFDKDTKTLIDSESIYSIDIIKNGQLLKSLMKQCNFEASVDLKVGNAITANLGVLINNDYEYINYGDYIIYSKEYNADTKSWSYVCYDMMLYSMIKYDSLNVTYPISIRDYINAVATKIGLTFANNSDEFTNYNQQVLKDIFKNQNVTYRDILDKLSEITASNILINDNNELELGYPTETNDTIDENYLKDRNVAFGEQFGPINKVVVVDSDSDISYVASNNQAEEGTQINITDNLFALNGEQQNIAQNILNKLNGLYYSINDFTTTGVCYYDFLDLFNVSVENTTYKCLLLNNEIHITTGITESIYTDIVEDSVSNTNKYELSNISNKAIQLKINQQEEKIESKVSSDEMYSAIEQSASEINSVVATKVGNNEIISKINQSAEQISINADKISLNGKQINLTSDNIEINSNNFSVDSTGNMECTNANVSGTITSSNATITGGSLNISTSDYDVYPIIIQKPTGGITYKTQMNGNGIKSYAGSYELFDLGSSGAGVYFVLNDNSGIEKISMLGNTGEIECVTLTQTSKEEIKKNFEKYNNALDTIRNIDIYKYNLKSEEDTDKKHIGLVIGNKYKYSKDVTSKENDSVDLYSFVSVCCKAIQEQQEIIEELNHRIELLERNDK